MNKFEQWLDRINEEMSFKQNEVHQSDLVTYVDDILQSLETLSSELSEGFNISEDDILNELQAADVAVIGAVGAGAGLAVKKMIEFSIKAPIARKMQAKVNKARLKLADIQGAINNADPKVKKKLEAKHKAVTDSTDEMQKQVDVKYEKSSSTVKSAIASEKIKGKLALNKRLVGVTDNEKEGKRLKDSMAKLQTKLNKEEAAFKELKPTEQDEKNATKEAEEAKKKQIKELKIKLEAAEKEGNKEAANSIQQKIDKLNEVKPKKEEPTSTEEKQEAAEAEVTKAKTAYDAVKDGDDEKAKLQAEIKFKQAQQKKAKLDANDELFQGLGDDIGEIMKKINALDPDSNTETDNSKQGQLDRLKALMKKADKSGDEKKKEKIQNLIDKVEAKESNSHDYTEFNMLIESEIKTIENIFILEQDRFLTMRERIEKLL